MTTEQIRNMMANTMKELNERKKALANIKGNQDPAAAFATKQFEPPPKVPLPPPKVVTIETVADKTKTIAALQAQIANRWPLRKMKTWLKLFLKYDIILLRLTWLS